MKVNFVFHHLGYTSIYQLLYYPFRSLKEICIKLQRHVKCLFVICKYTKTNKNLAHCKYLKCSVFKTNLNLKSAVFFFFFGGIYFQRVGGFNACKIDITLSQTYKKLHCKGTTNCNLQKGKFCASSLGKYTNLSAFVLFLYISVLKQWIIN